MGGESDPFRVGVWGVKYTWAYAFNMPTLFA